MPCIWYIGDFYKTNAFAVVARAFQILSDSEKKTKYDRFGGDPESRFPTGGQTSSPFSGFGGFQPSAGRTHHMYEEEISPEELFNRFFGGGGFGPFGKTPSASSSWD